MKIIITEGNRTIAVVDDWQGPVPQDGGYIYHPPLHAEDDNPDQRQLWGVMSVKSITYRMITRPAAGSEFTAHPEPFIEICV